LQFPILFTYWRQYCSLWRQQWRTCHFIKTACISSVLDCENVWTLTVDIFKHHYRDCFEDCSLDLTLIVSFWKIAFLVCRWKQIIISRSWNWTQLQFSTQCSDKCQCVLCNFQWFLFSIMSVNVLYLWGGAFFRDRQCRMVLLTDGIGRAYIASRGNNRSCACTMCHDNFEPVQNCRGHSLPLTTIYSSPIFTATCVCVCVCVDALSWFTKAS